MKFFESNDFKQGFLNNRNTKITMPYIVDCSLYPRAFVARRAIQRDRYKEGCRGDHCMAKIIRGDSDKGIAREYCKHRLTEKPKNLAALEDAYYRSEE